MKLKVLSIALGLGAMSLVSCQQSVNKNAPLTTDVDSVSYSLGANIGSNLKRSSLTEINDQVFLAALHAAIDGDSLKIELQQGNMIINKYIQKIKENEANENLEKGKKFLEENAKKEGVVTTESGLQYRVIKEGNGEKISDVSNEVKVHYRGTFIDGKEFDSSYKTNQPAIFPANRVIKGWTEALQLMTVGSKYELFIPANLAYGERGRPSIPGNSTLVFEVELLEIVKPEPKK